MRASLLVLFLLTASGHAARLELDKFLVHQDTRSTTYKFDEPRNVGALLQQNGTNQFVLRGHPRISWWEWSKDGDRWIAIPNTTMTNDARLLRLHQLRRSVTTKFLRLRYDHGQATGEAVFDSHPRREDLQRMVLIVNSTHDSTLPNHGQEFFPLLKSIHGWENTRAQQVWVRDFNPALVDAEPRPLAVFFSGSFKDWCEVDRSHWRGVEQVLKKKIVPIWASCGGAQALAILAETGSNKPWDCPHCRDPKAPRIPIYTHIGHTGEVKPCGDYSGCIFERGPQNVRAMMNDPVFEGLTAEFKVMESHCGQIAWPPRGWDLIATAGEGALTKVQCIKRRGSPIYAAQFHIEMEGTPETSRRIMRNFLEQAELWQRQR